MYIFNLISYISVPDVYIYIGIYELTLIALFLA